MNNLKRMTTMRMLHNNSQDYEYKIAFVQQFYQQEIKSKDVTFQKPYVYFCSASGT